MCTGCSMQHSRILFLIKSQPREWPSGRRPGPPARCPTGAWCGLPSVYPLHAQASWHGIIDFFGARALPKNKTMHEGTANKERQEGKRERLGVVEWGIPVGRAGDRDREGKREMQVQMRISARERKDGEREKTGERRRESEKRE